MEGDAVDDRDEEERPVRAAFRNGRVAAIVNGEEYMGCSCEIGEGVFESEGVRGLGEHEGHAGTEENDVGVFVLFQVFSFEVPIRQRGSSQAAVL